jgi:PAS domain S-box-containing protein
MTNRVSQGSTDLDTFAPAVRALLEALPDGMLVSDLDGTIELVSTRLEEMAGYGPGELAGRPVEDLVPERFSAAHVEHRRSYVASGLPARPMGRGIQLFLRTKEGAELPVDIALSAIEVGGRRLVVIAVRDASERTRTEAIERAYHERLAILGDRERLGRDLQEGAIHALFAIGMRLQAAVSHERGFDALTHDVEHCIAEIDGVISALRSRLFQVSEAADIRP